MTSLFRDDEAAKITNGKLVGVKPEKNTVSDVFAEINSLSLEAYSSEGKKLIDSDKLETGSTICLMVRVGNEKYALSLGSIQTIEDISADDIKLVQGKEVIQLRGSVIPIIRLCDVVETTSCKSPEDNLMVVIVKKGDRLAGLVVDELFGQQENVYLRGFGSFIIKTRAEKTGRNISKNVAITIPAHNIPAFKPAKTFMTAVK